MIDTKKLKAKMVEADMTQAKVALEIGMSSNSFGRKIRGESEFKLEEVVSVCKLLQIDKPCEIFLPTLSQICNKSA